LGGFLEPIGPGASVRGDFSADGVLLVRWASANLVPFSTFFTFFDRFLPVFRPYFALFPSMSCAYLYVHNFPRTRVSGFRRENLAFDKETAAATRPLDQALRRAQGREHGRTAQGPEALEGHSEIHNPQSKRSALGSGVSGNRPLDHALRRAQGREVLEGRKNESSMGFPEFRDW